MFHVIGGTDQTKGTAVPVQTLFVGVRKHRTMVFGLVVVAFVGRAATFQCQGLVRTGIALAAIAEDGRVGGWSPVVVECCVAVTAGRKREHMNWKKSVDVWYLEKIERENIPKPIDRHQLRQTNTILETAVGSIGACSTLIGALLVIFFFATQTRCCINVAHACTR